jgi:transposase
MNKDHATRTGQYNRPVTDEAIFKASKEIVVKFIEAGRVTPANFAETYTRVYSTVKQSVRSEDDERNA